MKTHYVVCIKPYKKLKIICTYSWNTVLYLNSKDDLQIKAQEKFPNKQVQQVLMSNLGYFINSFPNNLKGYFFIGRKNYYFRKGVTHVRKVLRSCRTC
ncbi:hypothetical protein FGO68_gene16263 [Halteria grandinella]|uniref:Uncharacterized protein n=1 Tax=Halteria grandinella TaxID=5974 RepID=A0A8J8SXX5_HALGN|nr:hypothetical protein FGO68_gene16263 [Halteria grandinella]